jgi:hypothetical protein
MTTRQAAAFWGVHYHTFRKLVRLGIIPGPIKLPKLARLIFDREQQEEAFNRFRGDNDNVSGCPTDKRDAAGWDDI